MQLCKLQAWNVCQYDHVALDFEYGITGITGHNGIGKTNLIETILYFAITGKIIRSDVNKEDLLRWGTAAGETQLEFQHDNKRYQLVRRVHTTFVGLDDMDDPAWKLRGTEASKFMEDALGTDFKVFHNACWTPQGCLTDIIRMTHAQRMTFFQKLTDVYRAERLRDLLTQFGLSKVPMLEDRSEEILRKESERVAVRDSLAAAEADLKEAQDLADKARAEAELLEPLRHLTPEETARKDKQKKEALLGVYKDKKNAAQAALDALDMSAENPPPLTAEERRAMAVNLDELEKQAGYLDRYLEDIRKTEEELEAAPPPDETRLEGLRSELADINAKNSALAKELEFYRKRVCPTCGQDLPMTDDQLAEKESELRKFQQDKTRLTAEGVALSEQNKARVLQTSNIRDRLVGLRSSLTACQAYVERESDALGEFDIEALKAREVLIRTAWERQQEYATRKKVLDEAALLVDRMQDALDALDKVKTVSAAQLQQLDTLRKEADLLDRALREKDRRQAELAMQVKHCEEGLLELRAHQVRRSKTEAKRKLLEEAHSVLHRENLPKIVMTSILQALNLQMSLYLNEFDTVFTARVTDDFDIVCSFPDKEGVPASLLSGGQSVALALAFKFAVATLFSSSMPLMVLDEPTVYLDTANVHNVAKLLEKVRDIAAKGTFILVATHDEALYPAMSRCVELGG